ncbi:iron chelate uptake ABC transporter family permease subunit [Pseudonocardia sp. MCCB 268]|nr:iron chelate uptake ABC transporter family permease subunit [Pseudonocardia cytotoxica]
MSLSSRCQPASRSGAGHPGERGPVRWSPPHDRQQERRGHPLAADPRTDARRAGRDRARWAWQARSCENCPQPLGDPGLLGVHFSAAFFVVCGIYLFRVTSLFGYVWFAFAGAFVASAVVFLIGTRAPAK